MSRCYHCVYRKKSEGGAYSCCTYPGNDVSSLGFLNPENYRNSVKLNISAIKQGVERGCFYWPTNFDPVWLIHCGGFTPIKEGRDSL